MTTFTFSAGKQVLDISNSAVTVFDAVTNDPFFLADWDTFRATGVTSNSSTLAYPLRIRAAAPGWQFNGGRFYGNIDANIDWDNFYEGGRFTIGDNTSAEFPRYNSAVFLPINTPPGILNDLVFGIRDDLNSGYVDGLRLATASSGFVINRPRAWIGRDDWLEMDDAVRTVTINDGFFENQSVWLSGTGAVGGSVFRANRCLVHQRRWPFRGNTTFFPVLKVWSGSNTPRFEFNDVCIVTGFQSSFEDSSVISGLLRTQATNGCRLLVLGGTHQNRSLITAYQNAGFSVLEDGAGSAATEEWNNRKAAFLNEGGPVTPPTTGALTSPCAFNVNVSATALTTPVILDVVRTNQQSSATSMSANYPAHDSGDLILVFLAMDNNDAWLAPSVTAPGGETVTTEQALIGNNLNSNIEQSSAIFSFQANADRAAGTMTVSFGGTDQAICTVIRVQKDTFKATAPRLGSITRTFEGLVSSAATSAAISAAQRQSVVFAMANYSYHTPTGLPSGWTERVNHRMDFVTKLLITRDAETTNAEDVPAVPIATSLTSNGWVALTGLILPKGAS